jgi:serine/threonine-protein kinase
MSNLGSPERLQAALHDAYVIERELGGGGMSRTYVAREKSLDRRVVIKVLPPDLAATVSHERFRREILVSASLQHPNIVGILSTDEVDGLPYFTMPFVDGESLRMRIERFGPLSVAQTVSILRDVARALAYAHERGVVHRDIKPDNVLLTAGAAVVADFGVAKALSSARVPHSGDQDGTITRAGTALGTPAYMAPEQCAGDPHADHRADLYAFGIMAYEMLTGAGPFGSRTPAQLMAAHISEAPQHIALKRPDVPRALADLIMRCLEKDPARRPATAAEVAQALEDPAMVSGAFASAPALPIPPAAARPMTRWAVIGATAMVLVVGGIFVANMMGDGGSVPPTTPPAAAVAVDERSIAVMPLVSLSTDSTDGYLAAGMTDELASALVRVGDFKVVSRSATQNAQATGATPVEIGRELSVAYLLEGTVQRQGDRVRVTTRLVDAKDGFTVWSDVYDRQGRDLFAVQDDLAQAVVEAVGHELGVTPGTALASAPAPTTPAAPVAPAPVALRTSTVNAEAYDHYLRGRALFQRRDARSLTAALREFELAVKTDPNFARAYAGIATVQAQLPKYTGANPRTTNAAGLAAANKALQLDSTLAEAYAARGVLEMGNWQFAQAERDLATAMRLDPSDPLAQQWSGELKLLRGDPTGATQDLRRAAALDPASPMVASVRVLARQAAGATDSAVALAKRSAEAQPNVVTPRWTYGVILLDAGRTNDALRELEVARTLAPTSPVVLGSLGAAYAMSAQTARAEEVLVLLQKSSESNRNASAIAKIKLALGQKDSALFYLEQAAERRDPVFVTEPLSMRFWDPIRTDPRFSALVQRVGLQGERVIRRPPPEGASGRTGRGGGPRGELGLPPVPPPQ